MIEPFSKFWYFPTPFEQKGAKIIFRFILATDKACEAEDNKSEQLFPSLEQVG